MNLDKWLNREKIKLSKIVLDDQKLLRNLNWDRRIISLSSLHQITDIFRFTAWYDPGAEFKPVNDRQLKSQSDLELLLESCFFDVRYNTEDSENLIILHLNSEEVFSSIVVARLRNSNYWAVIEFVDRDPNGYGAFLYGFLETFYVSVENLKLLSMLLIRLGQNTLITGDEEAKAFMHQLSRLLPMDEYMLTTANWIEMVENDGIAHIG